MAWRLALLLLAASRAWACSCAGDWGTAKQSWQTMPVVFRGTVEIADPDEDPNRTVFQEQLVRVRVDEAFKGASRGQIIEFLEGANDCAAKFRTGQRAVFYMAGTPGNWDVLPCTHSLGSAESGGDDLLFLRGLPKSAVGTRLSGGVDLYEDSPMQAFKRIGGVPNVRGKIIGPQGLKKEVETNTAGVFEFLNLPPGNYSVRIDVPKGLKIRFQNDIPLVTLSSNGSASVDFVLQADTRLSGRVLDAKGVPIKTVCGNLEAVEGRGEFGASFFNCSGENGEFSIEMMPPGKYFLTVHDEVTLGAIKSTSTLYYPGVRDRTRATVVSIEVGNYVENLDIRLPADEKRYRVTGRFQFADGVPVEGAQITFTYSLHAYSETSTTGANGSFGLSVVAGMEGQLSGRFSVLEPILPSCPDFNVGPLRRGLFRFIDATPLTLTIDGDRTDLTLKLDSPSCKSWPHRR